MAQHTPGPWVLNNHLFVKASNGFVVAQVRMPNARGKEYHEEASYSRANARLIAAAPELLEALAALERTVVALYRAAAPGGNYGANKDGSDHNQSTFADIDETVRSARAAIAKATAAA